MTRCIGKWSVRVDGSSIDASKTGLRPQLSLLLLNLDEICRTDAYCWPDNMTLANRLGCTERAVQGNLRELEAHGKIARVVTDRKRPERMGIVMLERIDPALPHCRTPEELQAAALTLRDRWVVVTHAKGEVRPIVLGTPFAVRPAPATEPATETRELPGKIASPARTAVRSRHERRIMPGTNVGSSEVLRTKNDSLNQQAEPPVLKVTEGPELTPEQADAVEGIKRAVERCDRPQAAQGVVAVAVAAIRQGHGPARVAEVAKESFSKDNPGGWMRVAIAKRADQEGGLLRDRPKAPPPPTLPISVASEDDIRRNRTRTYGRGCGMRGKMAGGVK